MFKSTLTALVLAVTALSANAATLDQDMNDLAIMMAGQEEELSYYCEWAYLYDGWGNYVYVWQCY